MKAIPLFVGFDQREAIAYHTFCQSVIQHASQPVALHPLALSMLDGYHETHTDGSNQFIYSRFLVPWLMDYQGWAIFADGDMVCRDDIAKLWALRDDRFAVMVVKHDYKTKYPVKYLGARNDDYPRKNWSSVMLVNCGHAANRELTPSLIATSSGAYLHRFEWLHDGEIGSLPGEWNWLAGEYADNPAAKIIHYTVGTPCFREYASWPMAAAWHQAKSNAQHADQLPDHIPV